MTLDDIKAAVDAGQTVHWANTSYIVHKDRLGQYLITYVPNGSCIGLTASCGTKLPNGPGSRCRRRCARMLQLLQHAGVLAA